MSKIKVIIMDIDGTLYNSKKEIQEETKNALLKAQSIGTRLILASGRPTTGLTAIGAILEMDKNDGYFVSYNGSRVVNAQTMEILYNQPLSIKEGKAVLEHVKQFHVYPIIDKDNYMYVNDVYAEPLHINGREVNIIKYEARGCHYLLCEKEDLAEFLDFELNKIMTAGEPDYLRENYKKMIEPFKDTLNGMFTADFYFEYTAKGIDKAKALDTILRPDGYRPEEIIAFGDGMNDISMIKYAGTGVAMGNAVEELKAAAEYVTASNDENGIAKALFRFMPELKEL